MRAWLFLVREETHVAQLGGEIVGVVGLEVKDDKVFIGENRVVVNTRNIFIAEIFLLSKFFQC